MPGYIDLHVHILPGLDDGPPHMEGSLALAQALLDRGFSTVVATPHCREGDPAPETVLKVLESFQAELKRRNIPLNVLPGSELEIEPHLVERLEKGELLTINHPGPYLLVEVPLFQPLPYYAESLFFELIARGYHPILAHPERAGAFQKDLSPLYRLVRSGLLCQLTLGSLTGLMGKEARKTAGKLLKLNMVHLLTTDAHGPGRRLEAALPALAKLKKYGKDAAGVFMRERPQQLIEGLPLELPSPLQP